MDSNLNENITVNSFIDSQIRSIKIFLNDISAKVTDILRLQDSDAYSSVGEVAQCSMYGLCHDIRRAVRGIREASDLMEYRYCIKDTPKESVNIV